MKRWQSWKNKKTEGLYELLIIIKVIILFFKSMSRTQDKRLCFHYHDIHSIRFFGLSYFFKKENMAFVLPRAFLSWHLFSQIIFVILIFFLPSSIYQNIYPTTFFIIMVFVLLRLVCYHLFSQDVFCYYDICSSKFSFVMTFITPDSFFSQYLYFHVFYYYGICFYKVFLVIIAFELQFIFVFSWHFILQISLFLFQSDSFIIMFSGMNLIFYFFFIFLSRLTDLLIIVLHFDCNDFLIRYKTFDKI